VDNIGNKLEGRSRMGRPRLRWVEDFGKNLRGMEIKRLRKKELGRGGWAYVFKEARLPESRTTKVIRLGNVFFFFLRNSPQ
jgi:hypothetical protein